MYAHDAGAGPKHARARALVEHIWRNGTGVISTQVLRAGKSTGRSIRP